jgi:uracil-DNA glycosylase
MTRPWNLDYWQSDDWYVANDRLKMMERDGVRYNPTRVDLFRSLASVHCDDVRVCLVGQDPYPKHKFATGMAFSIPAKYGRSEYPGTLREIFAEYRSDLGYEIPRTGDLTRWTRQGVLLWNAIPSCTDGDTLSHDWPEYVSLNREVFRRLSEKGIVFALLGSVARRYANDVDLRNNKVILTSHPSPRGSNNSRMPFRGSRLFSTINDYLNQLGLEPIDWRLDDEIKHGDVGLGYIPPDGVRGNILQNVTGVSLGEPDRRPKAKFYEPGREYQL